MKRLYIPIITICALFNFAEARTWTDNQGRSFDGEYISSSESEVTIQRSTDGESFKVPKSILSDKDQSYLKQLAKDASSFSHTETGIILPPKIEDLKIGETHIYDNPSLGVSVPYQSEKATATIYIYNYGKDDLIDDSEHRLISNELSKATSDLTKAEEMGIYKNVKFSDSGKQSGKEGIYTFISIPVTYIQVMNPNARDSSSPIKTSSFIGVGLFKGHYIKLRYSIRSDADFDESIQQRDAFVSALTSLVLEVDLRPIVKDHLKTYLRDPLSPEARNALGGITVYAEESQLVTLAMNLSVAPWFSIDDYPYGSELLGAYIAGQVDAQLNSGIFKSDEKAGREQVLKVYKRLKARDRNAFVKELDDDLSRDHN